MCNAIHRQTPYPPPVQLRAPAAGKEKPLFHRPPLKGGVIALLVLCLSPGFAEAQRQTMDRVIAIVDESVVLQSELAQRLIDVQEAAARSGRPLPPPRQLREEVLETLVIESLQLQFAERVSIRFDDDTINRVLANMAANNGMSLEQYVGTLESEGVYLLTREQVRRQLTIQELQRGVVNRRITITDQEIENFLNSQSGREVMAAQYLLDHILVPVIETDSPEIRGSKRSYAAELAVRVEDGEPLFQVRNTARAGGAFPVTSTEFGWRKADELPGQFSGLVADMEVGDMDGPIEAPNGFHVIQLADKRGGTEQMVNQTHIRHIMLSPNEIRDDEQSLAEIQRLRGRILGGEDFGTIARQHSDDDTSVVGGGDLDWVNEFSLPQDMQEVVDGLEVGELSEPFRTDGGWHIAEVLGRRVSDLSDEYVRSQAEGALRERKFDLELQNWLIEIREEAFVEYVD